MRNILGVLLIFKVAFFISGCGGSSSGLNCDDLKKLHDDTLESVTKLKLAFQAKDIAAANAQRDILGQNCEKLIKTSPMKCTFEGKEVEIGGEKSRPRCEKILKILDQEIEKIK